MNKKEVRAKALEVLEHFLDNMDYWEDDEYINNNLNENDIEEVNKELFKLKSQIQKRYNI